MKLSSRVAAVDAMSIFLKKMQLGDIKGGVVCMKHRSCQKCWFKTPHEYSQRMYESKTTRSVPLVDRPRSLETPECFGCFRTKPFHTSVRPDIIDSQRLSSEHEKTGYIKIE